MPYLEEIKKEYELVQQDSNVSQTSVKMALQYENWQNLPKGIASKILDHRNYPDLVADSDKQPVPDASQLKQECQIYRHPERIRLAYSLHRHRPDISSPPLDTLYTDDFPKIWELFEKDKIESKKEHKIWATTTSLVLRSGQDLQGLACRLGLYHWRKMLPGTRVFCLTLNEIDCVKPNALDAGLAFYFYQTPKTPGRTRNLKTGQPDMEEWLWLEVNRNAIQCTGACSTRTNLKVNMGAYFDNCAKRVRASKEQKTV